jgi:hypothetical protein
MTDRIDDPSQDTRTERLQVRIPIAVVVAIDDFRFATHQPNRAAAAREVMKRALTARSREGSEPA